MQESDFRLKMTDPQFKSIMATFLFDMGIFLCELLIFFCIRAKRDKGNVLLNWQPQDEYLREFDTNELRSEARTNLASEEKAHQARQERL